MINFSQDPPLTDSAIKAGRRHSTADSAILQGMHGAMKAHRKARADHDGEMDEYMKALGVGLPDDAPDTETPPEPAADSEAPPEKFVKPEKGVNPFAKKGAATKDIDLASLADMVEDAVREALEDLGLRSEDDDDEFAPYGEQVVADLGEDDGDADNDLAVHVYPKYAIACLERGDYQIPYSIEAGEVVIGTPDTWARVEKVWKPVAGAAPITTPQPGMGEVTREPPAGTPVLGTESIVGGAVKMLDDGSIVAQAITYGTSETPDMSAYSDYFTKATNLWLDQWDRRPMLYHHGQDEGTKDAPIIGQWTKAWADDAGVWMQGQLDKAHRYHAAIKELARRGLLRISTDSAPHLVQRIAQPNGTNEIKTWPVMAASLTPTAAEPRLLPAEVKALLAFTGVPIADTRADGDTTRESADGQKAHGVDDLELAAIALQLYELENSL